MDFKLVNLELQRSEPFTEILNETIKSRLGEDLMNELTQDELVQELIHSDENQETNLYQKFCEMIEKSLVPSEGDSDLIFVPTTKALRFYRNYFRKQMQDVLFVGVDDPKDPEAVIHSFKNGQND